MTDPNEGALATWDPGGRPPGERTFQSKRPVEANKNDAAGIDARSITKHTVTPGRSQCHIRTYQKAAPPS